MIFLNDKLRTSFEEKENLEKVTKKERDDFTKNNLEKPRLKGVAGGFLNIDKHNQECNIDERVSVDGDNNQVFQMGNTTMVGNVEQVFQMGNTTMVGNVENGSSQNEGLTKEQKMKILEAFF